MEWIFTQHATRQDIIEKDSARLGPATLRGCGAPVTASGS
jgi:hypothetical protein